MGDELFMNQRLKNVKAQFAFGNIFQPPSFYLVGDLVKQTTDPLDSDCFVCQTVAKEVENDRFVQFST